MARTRAEQTGFMTLKITLTGSDIMRTIVVPETMTLEDLHMAIQSVMGWDDSHLWCFTTTKNGRDGVRYERPYEDNWASLHEQETVDPAEVTLESVFPSRGAKLYYEYDFGDSWDHVITRMADSKETSIACIKSEGPDGIDDIGGVWGLTDFTEQLQKDPNSDECAETREWSGLDDDEEVRRYLAGRSLTVLTRDLRKVLSHVKLPVGGKKSAQPSTDDEELAQGLGDVFSCMLNESTWGIVEEALQNGGTCPFDDPENAIVPYLRENFPGIEIKKGNGDTGDRRLRMTVPASWVKLYATHAEEWQKRRERLDILESYACAAVRLYGVVSIEELGEIIEHYDPKVTDLADFLDRFLEVRADCPEMPFRKEGDRLIENSAFPSVMEDVDEKIAELRESQKDFPRWYPETREKFFQWEYADYFERSAETGALASEFKAVFKIDDRDELEELVQHSYSLLQDGVPPELVNRTLVEVGLLPKVSTKPRQRIIDALDELAEVVHARCLNGNSVRDVARNLPPPEPEKPKISRNALCPCGSGKKYKLCCGRTEK